MKDHTFIVLGFIVDLAIIGVSISPMFNKNLDIDTIVIIIIGFLLLDLLFYVAHKRANEKR